MSIHLVLFFTRGVSLRAWDMIGMLDREVALYKRLLREGFLVSLLTYGSRTDLEYEDRLDGIRILCNEHELPSMQYEENLCRIHAEQLASCNVIKTNQTYGADRALEAAESFEKPLVARCGYLWSFNAAREHGFNSPEAIHARAMEERVFKPARRVVVTTNRMKSDLCSRIPDVADRITVLPNYVDTERFKPGAGPKDRCTVLYVGRIAREKNLESLARAIEPLRATLKIIGEGRLRAELQERFASLNGRIVWEGNRPNRDLPRHLNRAGIFVLPSLYEGHPKVLIEAMACGLPVIGARSPGIEELIVNGETGRLCGTDPESIQDALEELLSDEALCARLGNNARKYVLERFALHTIAEAEASLLREVAAG